MSQNLKVGIIIGCIVLAAVIYFSTAGGSGGHFKESKILIKCANPTCNQGYELKQEEFSKMQSESPSALMPSMTPNEPAQGYKCVKCGKQTAFAAEECGNKSCGNVFMSGESRDEQYPDKCPKCGYSAVKEMEKQQK